MASKLVRQVPQGGYTSKYTINGHSQKHRDFLVSFFFHVRYRAHVGADGRVTSINWLFPYRVTSYQQRRYSMLQYSCGFELVRAHKVHKIDEGNTKYIKTKKTGRRSNALCVACACVCVCVSVEMALVEVPLSMLSTLSMHLSPRSISYSRGAERGCLRGNTSNSGK